MANDDVLQLKPNNLESTKFIIMQSASIDEMNEKYKKMFLSRFPLDKLIADYFLVSGTKFKDMKKDTKDSEEIMVTGQPRYDILYQADKIYDKNKICKQLNLDQNKKLILWITQTHGLPIDENEKNISAVFNAVKSLKNVQLVIKLHPAEDQNATMYKKDKSFNPVIVDGKADTYVLLYACDLMITRHSRTAMEAVALNKPVIILNLSGEPDPVEYVKEGVAFGVYKEEDLKPAIEKLLRDDSELEKNRRSYIEKYLYKIDGKATERVVNLIEKMIEEAKEGKEEV
jgi:CDP-glycerol glycerophosphotransferase (TagB/SpsB family)